MKIETPIVRRVRIPTKGVPWYKRLWIVLSKPLMWELMEDYRLPLWDGSEIVIEKGFIMDFASIPRIFWWLPGLSPVGILMIPGLVHDHYYKVGSEIGREYKDWLFMQTKKRFRRRYGDRLFLRIGKHVNGVVLIDYIAYAAVRLFGWHAWRKHRKEEKENELREPEGNLKIAGG